MRSIQQSSAAALTTPSPSDGVLKVLSADDGYRCRLQSYGACGKTSLSLADCKCSFLNTLRLHQVLACCEKECRRADEALRTDRAARHGQELKVDDSMCERQGLTLRSSLSQSARPAKWHKFHPWTICRTLDRRVTLLQTSLPPHWRLRPTSEQYSDANSASAALSIGSRPNYGELLSHSGALRLANIEVTASFLYSPSAPMRRSHYSSRGEPQLFTPATLCMSACGTCGAKDCTQTSAAAQLCLSVLQGLVSSLSIKALKGISTPK